MNPFFLFCLVGFAAAADLTVAQWGYYLSTATVNGTCSAAEKAAMSKIYEDTKVGFKNGNIFLEVGSCMKCTEVGCTTSGMFKCANSTAVVSVAYSTTDCSGPVANTAVQFTSLCKVTNALMSSRLDGKCGAVMDCVTNATASVMQKLDCKAKTAKTSDATAVSATVGLVISALALRL